MILQSTMIIPELSVPALKGLRGMKIRDTEIVSGTSIAIRKDSEGFFKAIISGPTKDNLVKAEKIMSLAIEHHQASLEPPLAKHTLNENHTQFLKSAAYDIETFFFEIHNFKAYL